MVSTKKSFGNVTLAGIFAAATLAAAVPAFASTTTVTWDFFGGANANKDIGSSATFTGTPSVTGLNLGITASGYTVSTTVDQNGNVQYGTAKSYDLYNKYAGASEQGLGLITDGYPSSDTNKNGMADGEISDTTPQTSKSKGTERYDTGMIQLDLSGLLAYATSSGAYITIGSLSSSSNDVAVFSGTNSAGQFGTVVGDPLSYTSTSSGVGSETLSLSDLTNPNTHHYYSYLNISVQRPGQSVLLSTLSLTFNTNNGGPSAAPVPATAGLALAGALGMGMMLLARRRRSTL